MVRMLAYLGDEMRQPPTCEMVWKQRKGRVSNGDGIKEITHLGAEKERPPKCKMVWKKSKGRVSDRGGIKEITHLETKRGDSQCEEVNGGHYNEHPYDIHGPYGHLK